MTRFTSSFLVPLAAVLVGCPEPEPTTGETGDAPPETADTGEPVPAPPSILADPISTAEPPWPSRTHPQPPTALWADATAPLPTTTWWQRLTLNSGIAIVHPLPYQVRIEDGGPQIAFAPPLVDATVARVPFFQDLSLGAQDPLGTRQVIDHGPLSATVQWIDGGRTLTVPIVRGMPYVTAQYVDHTPVVRLNNPIQSVNGQGVPQTLTDTRFELTFGDETWVIYTSSPITFDVAVTTMTASGSFSGSLRAAVTTPDTAAVLDAHAGRIPTGGTVDASVADDEATLSFDWESEGTGDLLMMRLPHHEPTLTGVTQTSASIMTIRGEMVGVVGDRWEMVEPLPTIGFRAPSGIAPERLEAVRSALQEDINLGVSSQDSYRAGKQVALLGRHAIIADELGETALAEQYRTNLRTVLEPWLNGTNSEPLVYDTSWGGVVTSLLDDPNANFGQGYYNDHHFHYGYHVYAAAALAEGQPEWIDTWGDAVEHLIRDYANPSDADPHHTPYRVKDWYAGHSWAAGIREDDDRNQESTSEAVNAYYAIALWGEVKGDDRIRDYGRLLMALELRAAHTYWQIDSDNPIYSSPFADNRVVGILFENRAEYRTFFGNRTEWIHGIQWLPFTPASELLLRRSWMDEAYPVAATSLGAPDIEEGWRGFVIMARGISRPDIAWDAAQSLDAYDDGNSKTNTLYWLATRPK